MDVEGRTTQETKSSSCREVRMILPELHSVEDRMITPIDYRRNIDIHRNSLELSLIFSPVNLI
jgi:hypothetical protein